MRIHDQVVYKNALKEAVTLSKGDILNYRDDVAGRAISIIKDELNYMQDVWNAYNDALKQIEIAESCKK